MGFGEVIEDEDELVETLIEYMKNGWRACVYASRFSLVVFLRMEKSINGKK